MEGKGEEGVMRGSGWGRRASWRQEELVRKEVMGGQSDGSRSSDKKIGVFGRFDLAALVQPPLEFLFVCFTWRPPFSNTWMSTFTGAGRCGIYG